MKTNEVKILLQKYYDGLTLPGEESKLEEYFLSGRADPEFEADQLHFMAVAAMKDEEISVPEDLEVSVLYTLKKVQEQQVRKSRRIYYLAMSIAAGLLIMVSTFLFLSDDESTRNISDPKIAYAESLEALATVSKLFNEGTSQLAGLSKMSQAMEPLQKLNTLGRTAKRLSDVGKLQDHQ